jgi:hypothetical protein
VAVTKLAGPVIVKVAPGVAVPAVDVTAEPLGVALIVIDVALFTAMI